MTYMLLLNCALKLVEEIILYYDARSKKHQIIIIVHTSISQKPIEILQYFPSFFSQNLILFVSPPQILQYVMRRRVAGVPQHIIQYTVIACSHYLKAAEVKNILKGSIHLKRKDET